MKVVQVHNRYQNPTGDDAVVQEELELLEKNGHTVLQFTKTNSSIAESSFFKKLRMASSVRSSKAVASEFSEYLKREQPDLVHAHNLFPLITPVVFDVCSEMCVPVVQTLHNYRLVCVNTLFYRDGQVCEDCLTKSVKESIKHKCYNGSRVQSALMADMIAYHWKRQTWDKVDKFICLSEFAKSKFVEGGIPEDKLMIKPNFINDVYEDESYGDYFLYAGKLEEQKGLEDFKEMIDKLPEVQFKVAGYCEDPSFMEDRANVEYLGQLSRDELMQYMRQCRAVLFLSKMYEGMPMTILEAFAHKKSVIARNRGAMSEMIKPNVNGDLYDDQKGLAACVQRLNDPSRAEDMGQAAYGIYQEKYSDRTAYDNLIQVYNQALA